MVMTILKIQPYRPKDIKIANAAMRTDTVTCKHRQIRQCRILKMGFMQTERNQPKPYSYTLDSLNITNDVFMGNIIKVKSIKGISEI